MMKKHTIITTEYYRGLGEFLDTKQYRWEYHLMPTSVCIIKIREKLTPTEIFNLAIEYKEWLQKIEK